MIYKFISYLSIFLKLAKIQINIMTYKKTQTVFYEKSASAYLTLPLFYFDANIEILILTDDLFLINGHFPNFLE